MRPFPWIIRVSLFAVGLSVGMSHYQAPPAEIPIILELHFGKQNLENPHVYSELDRCSPSAPPLQQAVYSTVW
jgi:hypothetical protein